MKRPTKRKLALHCADVASEKKGSEILVLDIRRQSQIADYFVLVSGNSDRHVRAMVEEIAGLNEKEFGEQALHVSGMRDASWVIMDYVDVVVHLFTEVARDYYKLERLWGDAKVIRKL